MRIGGQGALAIADPAHHVDKAAQNRGPDRHAQRPAGQPGRRTARNPLRRLQRNDTGVAGIEMRLHLGIDGVLSGADLDRIVNRGQFAFDPDIQNRAVYRCDFGAVSHGARFRGFAARPQGHRRGCSSKATPRFAAKLP